MKINKQTNKAAKLVIKCVDNIGQRVSARLMVGRHSPFDSGLDSVRLVVPALQFSRRERRSVETV